MAEDARWVSFMEAPRALPSCQEEEEAEEEEDAGKKEEQRRRDSEPASTSSKPCVWGTWEQLLLASAVKKHGINKWALVSAELQARARAVLFTPEACRAEYYAIKGRYSNIEAERGGDGANDIPWFDELRRLRVSQLKTELEHYDASIGSLESKLKKLTAEREKSMQISPLLSGQILWEASLQKDGLMPEDSTDACQLQQACGVLAQAPPLISHRLVKTSEEKVNIVELEAVNRKEAVGLEPSMVKDDTDVEVAGRMPEARIACIKHKETENTIDSMEEAHLRAGEVETGIPTTTMSQRFSGDDKGRTADTHLRSDTVNTKIMVSSCADVAKEFGGKVSPVGSELVAVAKPDSLEGTKQNSPRLGEAHKPVLQASLNPSVALEYDCAKVAKAQSESLSISGPSNKSVQSSGFGWHPDGSPLLLKQREDDDRSGLRIDKEAGLQDGDDKQKVCKLLCAQVVNEVKQVVPVESADSTEVKQQQEEVPAVTETKQVGQVATFGKMTSAEEAMSKQVGSKGKGVASKEVATTSGPADTDGKLRSSSSTENSELHEVWGESAEVVENKRLRTKKRARTSSWGKKRKLKKQSTSEPTSIVKEERDARSPAAKMTELSVKAESVTMSHGGSDSMHDKAENDFDAETTWHQMERLSGDSRVEKSEMGSFVEGNEDISPMSRRNKREPKVSGKLIPLLESLRTIGAHKCAPFFKHNQEIQDNPRYEQLIRSPVDLGLIRSRLEEGQYTGSLHFFRDLLLMINNALVYYSRDTQEYGAAIGLRECIVKEMATVFETEALLKREGPSFRKRDAVKAGLGLQKKRKAVERSLATDMASKDVSRPRGQSDLSTSMDSRCNQNISAVKDVHQATTDTKQALKDSGDTKIASFSEGVRGLKILNELKKLPFEKTASTRKNEMKEQGLSSSANIVEGAKHQEKLGGNPTIRKVTAGKGGTGPRTTAGASSKGIGTPSKTVGLSKPAKKDPEGKISGIHPSAQQTDTAQEPVKRGVGRPPKHSQQRSSRKAKQVEAPIPPRKRVRR